MVIQVEGINTQNKGAELMLIAILEELEARVPNSDVLINPDSNFDITLLPKFKLNVKLREGLRFSRYAKAIKKRLGYSLDNSIFGEHYCSPNVDFILDGSGFKYSDQWNRDSEWINNKSQYYQSVRKKGVGLVFLPQAFGPFETENGKVSARMVLEYGDLVFARDRVSFSYIKEANASKKNTGLYESCDFTFKVKGEEPPEFKNLENQVAIIPNFKMITHGGYKSETYLSFLVNIIKYLNSRDIGVYLLNHEGKRDYELCQRVNDKVDNACAIISGLTAKEIKGAIGLSKFVISSRFHGVASSLSQGVPCLATSWNHKYEMLFDNFGQVDSLISHSEKFDNCIRKIDHILDNREEISQLLLDKKSELMKQIDMMWNLIFEKFRDGD